MYMHMNMYHYAAKAIALCLQISHAKYWQTMHR